MPGSINISVVIVSYECLGPLKECLGSLLNQGEISFEIIVVDNDSGDGTGEFLKSENIKSVLLYRNIGFGAAVNIGQLQAGGEYLFILNPDTVVPPGTLKSLYEFATATPGAGIVSPLIIWPDGTIQRSARQFPSRYDFLFGRGSPLFKLGLTGERQAGYIVAFDSGATTVPAVSATAAFIETALFRSLGCFDERYFLYLEDLDLCRRVAASGKDIWMLPEIKVAHAWRQSSGSRPYFASYHHHLSVYKYFRKFYPRQYARNFLLAIALTIGFIMNSILLIFGRRS